MTTAKKISEITQKTRSGLLIKRVNYETHSEFILQFTFTTGDILKIINTPMEHYSKVEIKLDTGKNDDIVLTSNTTHHDPISFFNALQCIPHYANPNKIEELNGIIILYNSSSDIYIDQINRMLMINEIDKRCDEIDMGSGKSLKCEIYQEIYNPDNADSLRGPLTKTNSIYICDHADISRCTFSSTEA